ncbi:ABC transporter permease [Cupriavidus nantongensis]|uniref:ABC-2 type transporter transmembrane domain-containing protein n=1 Tax=Cupriavidus nantongensis TaxID=1796606 RepID=A0A142JEI6_9BURK|nr:ABC transporter permease [Cupriavidus nantongensis]AMR76498.1 hypothetical protein A2G96_01370 [Cupriavidus nantongensis]
MKSLLDCTRILVVEQIREPIGVFWSLVAPVGYLAFRTSAYGDTESQHYEQSIGWCLAYIAMMTSLFGFGLYLIGRRESGFVRSFLTSVRKRTRFLIAQYLASLCMSLLYGAGFLVLTSNLLTWIPVSEMLRYFAMFAAFCSLFMLASTCLATLPLTFQSASSLLSIAATAIIVIGIGSTTVAGSQALALVNPFLVGARAISETHWERALVIACIGHALMFVCLGVYGAIHQRINPQWSNR